MPDIKPAPELHCPLCGGANACSPASSGTFSSACWCMTAAIPESVLAQIPADKRGKACLCPRCAQGSGSGT